LHGYIDTKKIMNKIAFQAKADHPQTEHTDTSLAPVTLTLTR